MKRESNLTKKPRRWAVIGLVGMSMIIIGTGYYTFARTSVTQIQGVIIASILVVIIGVVVLSIIRFLENLK